MDSILKKEKFKIESIHFSIFSLSDAQRSSFKTTRTA